MFDNLLGAVTAHLCGLDQGELVGHLASMIPNLPDGAAAEVGTLLEQAESDPGSLTATAIAYVQSHPELIQQYAPELYQGILSKFGV